MMRPKARPRDAFPFAHELQRITLPDGRVRYWRASSGPVFDAKSGAFLGYRGIAADVTDTVLRDAAPAVAARACAFPEERRAAQARRSAMR